MPLTVGTAGHIDHGKTWLVRALTGKDTDRLPEERERGISIDLGYAPLDLPDGRRLSLIDVPGHERFVRNMVAGATGIDLFLLVVDAAEGARPQTHEHLAILSLLGIEHGVVAVTKADAVDAETLELAVEEARELVPGAEVVAVSAKTGRRARRAHAPRWRAPPTLCYRNTTRRATTRRASTSTACSRCAGSGRSRPGRSGRDRSAPATCFAPSPADATSACAASRCTTARSSGPSRASEWPLALPGVERHELRRGDALLARGAFATSYRLDVALEELAPIADGARLHVHHGTAAVPARVVRAGEGFAQLRLAAPVVAARGDRVVLRGETTVGGGVVIDPAPRRHADLDALRAGCSRRDDRARAGARRRCVAVLGRPGSRSFAPSSNGASTRPTRSTRA